MSRHGAAGRPKAEVPAPPVAVAAAAAAAADDDHPTASLMHRINSSPAITDRHGRHQSRASPGFVTADELWKTGGRIAQHGRLIKPADDNIQLGPPSRTMWQGGSVAGRRTPSVESNKQQPRCVV